MNFIHEPYYAHFGKTLNISTAKFSTFTVLFHLQVVLYSTSIFEEAGLDVNAAQIATISLGGIYTIMTIISMVLIERLGRRTLHLHGLGGVFIVEALLVAALVIKVRQLSISLQDGIYWAIVGQENFASTIFAF